MHTRLKFVEIVELSSNFRQKFVEPLAGGKVDDERDIVNQLRLSAVTGVSNVLKISHPNADHVFLFHPQAFIPLLHFAIAFFLCRDELTKQVKKRKKKKPEKKFKMEKPMKSTFFSSLRSLSIAHNKRAHEAKANNKKSTVHFFLSPVCTMLSHSKLSGSRKTCTLAS